MWVFTPPTALRKKRLLQLLAPQQVPAADLPPLLLAAHPSTGCLWPGSAPGVRRLCSACLFAVGMHVPSSTALPRKQEGVVSTKVLLRHLWLYGLQWGHSRRYWGSTDRCWSRGCAMSWV